MINYSTLNGRLLKLELLVPVNPSLPTASCSSIIRKLNSLVQVFGLDSVTLNSDLPVVVTVGSNYTQGSTQVPRDIPSLGIRVEELPSGVKSFRQHLNDGLVHYKTNPRLWYDNCAASSDSIIVPPNDNFHLVLTNFCLWITDVSWQNIGTPARADLLENNPPVGSLPAHLGQWTHLEELHKQLQGVQVLWIGHGIHCEVFAFFRQFVRSMGIVDWLLMPNLAFQYKYNDWNHLKQYQEPSCT